MVLSMLTRMRAMVVVVASMLPIGNTSAGAQTPVPPELAARLEKEKAARLGCKVEICKAFAAPSAGPPISCDISKTWLRDEITAQIVGGSYVWGYGHISCTFKANLDRAEIGKAMLATGGIATFATHTMVCNVDDKDSAKGQAFQFKADVTPAMTFDKRKATALNFGSIKTEGSAIATAAVASIQAVDKVSGVISRSGASEMNSFLFRGCKEAGVTISE